MKICNLALGLSLLLLVFSCKKDEKNEQTCRITKVQIEGTNTYAFIYTYDSNGKLIKSDLGQGLYSTYTWETNKVTVSNYCNNQLSSKEEFTLNNKGQAASSAYYSGGTTLSKNTSFSYNSEGYLIQKTSTLASDNSKTDTYTFEYTNGNLTKETHAYSYSGLPSSETTYEYYPEKFNITVSANILGKANVNLLKKSVYTIKTATPVVVTTEFTYGFDTDGKVNKQTITVGGQSTSFIPLYECN